MAAYWVGPRMLLILWIYWDRLTMVSRDGRYFGLPCKGCCRVTQGDPLSPTIFNVFMDAVIFHWVMVVEATKEGMEGIYLSIQYMASYFYANNVLIASPQPERLQRVSDVLTGLF